MPTKSERIDKLLVELGLVSTRARAQAMILAGHVLVNDVPVTKSGEMIKRDATIRLREPELKYVSRGALKLKAALETFKINVQDKVAIDIGSSTGGFTEILLENGASKVYAIDVGTNQLAWKIRSDPRVVVHENVNARFLKPEYGNVQVAVMDVSFISVRLILPSLVEVLGSKSEIIILFKPQFEVGREYVKTGGIVQDQEVAQNSLEDLIAWFPTLKLECLGKMDSPILGTDGNKEYLIHIKKNYLR